MSCGRPGGSVWGRSALFAALLSLAACDEQQERSGQERSGQEPAGEGEPKAVDPGPLAGRRQLVTIRAGGWDSTAGSLELWRRAPGGGWRRDDVWKVDLGRGGLAWGIGLHGEGAPAGLSGARKEEGDGKTPAGLFALGSAYGYAPGGEGRLPYVQVDESWRCIDDPTSAHYGRILDESAVEPDWSSAERMRRPDALYRWVVEVRHNPERVPRRGSCIFFHLSRAEDGAGGGETAGCAAMPGAKMRALLTWLDPEAQPAAAILPDRAHRLLRPRWQLP